IITFPLRILVTQISVGFASGVLQLDIIREGTLIFDGDRSFQFDVAPACSGIRSLITLFALTTIYGFVSYKAFWRRGVMMLASVPLAILGNVLRITTVIVVGDVYGMKAGVAIEQKLGFLTFLVAIIGIMVLGHFLNEEQPVAEQNDEK
ncbi:MAG: exosortase/archaeosortase family protein, partial [Verrucomicrobia bacterium]|nr:exosortase/archaeosortase family protein [Verrucomicrobiota bacterium]